MNRDDIVAKIQGMYSSDTPATMGKDEFCELLFGGCCSIYKEMNNEDLYIYPVWMYTLLSAMLSSKTNIDSEESKAWLRIDVLSNFKDPNFFLRMYDNLISAYNGPAKRQSKDILLEQIQKADYPEKLTVLGKSVWDMYADFIMRDSNEIDKNIRNTLADTMCFLYCAFSKVKIA